MDKAGFGGGCHWCTEAVFQSVKGITKVKQGYLSTSENPAEFYEGVLVYYEAESLSFLKLIKIHLSTHKCTAPKINRKGYLSAVYCFNKSQFEKASSILNKLQRRFDQTLITRAFKIGEFKSSRKEILNYYRTNPNRPFCKLYIEPKLNNLRIGFPDIFNTK